MSLTMPSVNLPVDWSCFNSMSTRVPGLMLVRFCPSIGGAFLLKRLYGILILMHTFTPRKKFFSFFVRSSTSHHLELSFRFLIFIPMPIVDFPRGAREPGRKLGNPIRFNSYFSLDTSFLMNGSPCILEHHLCVSPNSNIYKDDPLGI
jgi:hypothetical protein